MTQSYYYRVVSSYFGWLAVAPDSALLAARISLFNSLHADDTPPAALSLVCDNGASVAGTWVVGVWVVAYTDDSALVK